MEWNSNNTVRAVASLIFVWFYLLIIAPSVAIALLILVFVLALIYYGVIRLTSTDAKNQPKSKNRGFKTKDEIALRKAALKDAGIYLAPYENIWGNLKLSNRKCRLTLQHDGTIRATDLTVPNDSRRFKIIQSDTHTLDELWNMFCMTFSWQTSYDGLIELCSKFKVKIKESQPSKSIRSEREGIKGENIEKLDINNASQMELTALPGVNVIMAKRIIKRREELRGFKSVDAFLDFIKLSSHAESVIKERVCVNKMKGSLKIERNKERKIDL
jgi:hypothetical protein